MTDNTDKHSCCCCGHSHGSENLHSKKSTVRKFIPEICSSILLIVAWIVFSRFSVGEFFILTAYLIALLPVGIPVIHSSLKEWSKGDIFNEFTLMILAAAGAFLIREYPEGVAILLFYSIGEKLEDVVSGDVRSQIKNLIGSLPDTVTLVKGSDRKSVTPEEAKPGDIIAVKPGEAVSLDGILYSDAPTDFDTSAMTGESVPRSFSNGEEIAAGLIPLDREVLVKVSRVYSESSMNRIIQMIEDAGANRAPSETILRKITRWYTPAVIAGAVLLMLIPWIVGLVSPSFDFIWSEWLRRSLVFLVCSCPCALIVSVPLTYFASIGMASRNGILFKGHRQLDDMRKFRTLCLDKTGTVTTGTFHIEEVKSENGFSQEQIIGLLAAIDAGSTHPLALAILSEAERLGVDIPEVSDVLTIPHGIRGIFEGKTVIAGSEKLMQSAGIKISHSALHNSFTPVFLALDNICIGAVLLSDTVKPEVPDLIQKLKSLGVESVGILSGDHEDAVNHVASQIGADFHKSSLRPEDKETFIRSLTANGVKVAFTGDGINDGPALAVADTGIAMGQLGSDLAIETADVVIATDDLGKIAEGISISRRVRKIIMENVTFAFGVKGMIMLLGAMGIASLWAAVFADTGVTLITILWTLYRLKIWRLKRK